MHGKFVSLSLIITTLAASISARALPEHYVQERSLLDGLLSGGSEGSSNGGLLRRDIIENLPLIGGNSEKQASSGLLGNLFKRTIDDDDFEEGDQKYEADEDENEADEDETDDVWPDDLGSAVMKARATDIGGNFHENVYEADENEYEADENEASESPYNEISIAKRDLVSGLPVVGSLLDGSGTLVRRSHNWDVKEMDGEEDDNEEHDSEQNGDNYDEE
ncbi:hypothetical protein BY458DRAFT_505037 [Sporodiniella umbellata]|nr:hypothetical protein BY458DRAFT_505037 [Sporodiniella umbellata]